MSLLAREDHETVSWSLKEFSIGKDFKWSKPEEEDDGTELSVDRATHEFGIVYYDSLNSSHTQGPVYFEAKTARAACKHDSCGKVTVLFEHVQLNLIFESTGALSSEDHISATTHAHSFVNALEVLAGAAQNRTFRIHTVIAKGFNKSDDFDMAARGYTERVIESWMSQSTGSSHWSK
ncbi:SAS complex subunit [Didymella pomorum]|uniref:SAS complex subunit n=1 Tax=Didymella pomorum TaxID=749634 RepID=A0A9W8ZB77_9PLEO|nr:SAS complex subunit [Didymella pomorum]